MSVIKINIEEERTTLLTNSNDSLEMFRGCIAILKGISEKDNESLPTVLGALVSMCCEE